MTTAVGFLGLGQMGSRMAANVARANGSLVVWNRTREKAEGLARSVSGVSIADTPAEVAAEVDILVSMVADERAAHDVYEAPDGLLSRLRPGAVVVEMSTLAPATVLALGQCVAKADGALVDAPVSGSVAAAEAGELTVMIGGRPQDVERVDPVLAMMAARTIPMGPLGTGSAMKLAVNTVVMGLNQAVAEALVLAERAGIERTAAYAVFAASAVAAPFVHYRRAAFEHPESYPPAFAVRLGEKDLDLILDLAEQVGSPLPQTRANRSVLAAAAKEGFADADVSAVAEYLRACAPASTEGSY